jgi:hypothetical protein
VYRLAEIYSRTEEGVNVVSDIEVLVMFVALEREDTTNNPEKHKTV